MMQMVGWVTLLLAVSLLGCAEEPVDSTDSPAADVATTVRAEEEPPPTLPASTTTEAPDSWPGELQEEDVFLLAQDLRYAEERDGHHPRLVDLFVPLGEGPWPVAIAFHADPGHNTKPTLYQLGRSLADAGVLTFVPNWGGEGIDSPEAVREWIAGEKCTYWYAVEHAPLVGGNPDDITLIGFSGGVNGILNVTMSGGDEDFGCESPKAPIDPSALVLFEGDYLLAPWWDTVLEADPDLYGDWAVWNHLDEYNGGPIHVLVDRKTAESTSYTVDAVLAPGKTMDDYMALRDPDGSLEADLTDLGAFEDEDIDLVEFSQLFELRAIGAGHEVTWTEIEQASHTMTPAAIEAIVSLVIDEG